jgi:hypothetical protein
MDQTLSLGWTQAQARSRSTTYRRVLGLNLLIYMALALVALAVPGALSRAMALPPGTPSAWVAAWGGLLLVLSALYLPGLVKPVELRYANAVGIPARLVLAVVYLCLGRGFLWLAALEAVFAILLGMLYFKLAIAELMSRP